LSGLIQIPKEDSKSFENALKYLKRKKRKGIFPSLAFGL
jgi:hypothetical protein